MAAGTQSLSHIHGFLYEIQQCVNSGSTSRPNIKENCRQVRDLLESSVKRMGRDSKDVSKTRNLVKFVEDGKWDKISSEQVLAAQDEFRLFESTVQKGDDRQGRGSSTGGTIKHHSSFDEPVPKHRPDLPNKNNSSRNTRILGNNPDRHEIPPEADTNRSGYHRTDKNEERIRRQDQDVAHLRRENVELRDRLSKFAGDTLRTGNHTLTDLSDPYRPTKIAEHYGELYDNLWTDALDALLKTNQERPAIEILGNILKKSYDITEKMAEVSSGNMTNAFVQCLVTSGGNTSINEKAMTTINRGQIAKQLGFLRKEHVDISIPSVQQTCEKQMIPTNLTKFPHVQTYARECARLTWLMNIQDPPIVMKWANPGETVQTKYFREYTRRGQKVEYITWPALLLRENGEVLLKGVVQPTQK